MFIAIIGILSVLAQVRKDTKRSLVHTKKNIFLLTSILNRQSY